MQEADGRLERRLGLFPVTNIVIANMIGAGIFTTSGLLMGDLGVGVKRLAGGFAEVAEAVFEGLGEVGHVAASGGEVGQIAGNGDLAQGQLSGGQRLIVGWAHVDGFALAACEEDGQRRQQQHPCRDPHRVSSITRVLLANVHKQTGRSESPQ